MIYVFLIRVRVMVKVFFCEDTGRCVFTKMWWCDHCNTIAERREIERGDRADFANIPWQAEDPIVCPKCYRSAAFSTTGTQTIYRRVDTHEEIITLREHPGACYADPHGAWDSKARTKRFGVDGRALVVILPDGCSWYLDSRASNCTLPNDNDHRCWVRRGSPESEDLHVDKNGLTCQAGAGSIVSGNFHGFLHNGHLVGC